MVSNKILRFVKVNKILPFKKSLIFLALSFFVLFQSSNVFPQNTFNESQIKDFEKIIENWIEKNPKKVKQVLDKLLAQEEIDHKNKTFEMLSNHTMDPVMGNPEGDVILYEFFDYNCGYCKSVFNTVIKTLDKDKNTKLVLKELPILSQTSINASFFALAAKKQNLYSEFHTKVMQFRGRLTDEILLEIANQVGLDIEKLKKDIQSDEIKLTIEKNKILAERLNITGTPSFVIGNTIIPGALNEEQLLKYIKKIRNENS